MSEQLGLSSAELDASKPKIKNRIKDLIEEDENDELLSYILLLIANNRSRTEFTTELASLLTEAKAVDFAGWLWGELGKSNAKASSKKTNVLDEIAGEDEEEDPDEEERDDKTDEEQVERKSRPASVIVEPEKPQRRRRGENRNSDRRDSRNSDRRDGRWTGSDRASTARGGQRERRLLGGALSAANRSTRRSRIGKGRELEEREEESRRASKRKAISIRGGGIAKKRNKKVITLRKASRDGEVQQKSTSFRVTFNSSKKDNDAVQRTSGGSHRLVINKPGADDSKTNEIVKDGKRYKKVLVRRRVSKRKGVSATPASQTSEANGGKKVAKKAAPQKASPQKDLAQKASSGIKAAGGSGDAKIVVKQAVSKNKARSKNWPSRGGERILCRFWPNCTNPTCEFMHPKSTKIKCKFGLKCFRPDCKFVHPAGWYCAPVPKYCAPVPKKNASESGKIPCRYDPNCTRIGCYFSHPIRDANNKTFMKDTKALSKSLPKTPPPAED